jgi:hypothetical protein
MDAHRGFLRTTRVVATIALVVAGFAGGRRALQTSLDATAVVADYGDAAEPPYAPRRVAGSEARAASLAAVSNGRRFRAVLPTFGRVPEALLQTEPNATIHVFTDGSGGRRYVAALLSFAAVPRVVAALHEKGGPGPARDLVEAATTPAELRRLANVEPGAPLYLVDVGDDRLKTRPSAARLIAEGPEAALWVVP